MLSRSRSAATGWTAPIDKAPDGGSTTVERPESTQSCRSAGATSTAIQCQDRTEAKEIAAKLAWSN
jgi:hypothetical protein